LLALFVNAIMALQPYVRNYYRAMKRYKCKDIITKRIKSILRHNTQSCQSFLLASVNLSGKRRIDWFHVNQRIIWNHHITCHSMSKDACALDLRYFFKVSERLTRNAVNNSHHKIWSQYFAQNFETHRSSSNNWQQICASFE